VDGRAAAAGGRLRLNAVFTFHVKKLQPSFHQARSAPFIWLGCTENERVLKLLSTILGKL
jgi:hypothetical protein